MVVEWGRLGLLLALSCTASAGYSLGVEDLKVSGAPNILGTVAVPIHADRFADSLTRARKDASNSPILLHLVQGARSLTPLQKLSYVQSAVNANVRWMSDVTEWGQHDYWASASDTLEKGAGDAEDRAIVKLQALRTLGLNNSDLFLTLARDRVGGPVTVLVARFNGEFYVLDDTGGPPYPVEQRQQEFKPIMSFGMYGAWVHVTPVVQQRNPGARIIAASSRVQPTARK